MRKAERSTVSKKRFRSRRSERRSQRIFAALSDLSNNPAGTTERVSVIAKARALGENLNQTRQIFTSLQSNLDSDIQSAVQRVNNLTEQIASLNQQISYAEVAGETANDFRDQRQTLLQELTNLDRATAREDSQRQVTVTIGGLLLVGGARFATLDSNAVNAAGLHSVTYRGPDGSSFDASALITGGKIGSRVAARDGQVQDVIERLDLFAQALVTQFNTNMRSVLLKLGVAGGNLFTPIAATAGASANVQVDAASAADPRLVAAAASTSALPGEIAMRWLDRAALDQCRRFGRSDAGRQFSHLGRRRGRAGASGPVSRRLSANLAHQHAGARENPLGASTSMKS